MTMDRNEMLAWLEANPKTVHGAPTEIVARCERDVRDHAVENAWMAAKAYVEGRMHDWEKVWGCHASGIGVAREVCPMLSRELAKHEPRIGADDAQRLVGEDFLNALEPEARARVVEWVRELAQEIEHRIWKEVIHFTKKEARELAREGRLSTDETYAGTENYYTKASEIAHMLVEKYEEHAHEEPP
jgi:hypothetical protein